MGRKCYRNMGLHSTWASCMAPHTERELQRRRWDGSRPWGGEDPLASPVPSLVAGVWYVDSDLTEVVAAGVVQDLVTWVSGGCSAEIQNVLSVRAFPIYK